MSKVFTVIFLVIIGATCISGLFNNQPKKFQHLNSSLVPKPDNDLCGPCIQEAVEVINILLNLILNEGIIQSCDALCGALANRTGSQTIGEACDALCDLVGIGEFVKALVKADLDPIWYCEIIDLCPGKN